MFFGLRGCLRTRCTASLEVLAAFLYVGFKRFEFLAIHLDPDETFILSRTKDFNDFAGQKVYGGLAVP